MDNAFIDVVSKLCVFHRVFFFCRVMLLRLQQHWGLDWLLVGCQGEMWPEHGINKLFDWGRRNHSILYFLCMRWYCAIVGCSCVRGGNGSFFFVDDSICYRWADYIQCHCLRGGNRRCCDINRLQEGRIFRSKMFRSSNCQSLLSGHQLSVDIAGEKGISLHDFYCIAFFSMEIIQISECIVTHVHQYKVGHYACVTMYG